MRPPPRDDYRRQRHECIEANDRQLALLYAALYTIALGGGGIKSNVSGFGSDQFDIKDPKDEKAMIFFFNRFYFGVSIGSLFSVIVLVYVQDNVGRGWGYGISAGTLVIAVAVLLCGTPWYRFKKPQGSPLTAVWRVLFLALKKRNQSLPSHPRFLNDYKNRKVFIRFFDKATVLDDDCVAGTTRKDDRWIVSTVTQVEEGGTRLNEIDEHRAFPEQHFNGVLREQFVGVNSGPCDWKELAEKHQYRTQLVSKPKSGEKELESLNKGMKMASIKSMEIVEP
ncbi:hypothetical protein V6N13_106786 [Hibiscus sabdariffa]|uniref:Uncharacterized protein n=1 Tax=Hibiscus sabdariffa TaxID=183260 RepID=A0ABR2F1S2_9ROSI